MKRAYLLFLCMLFAAGLFAVDEVNNGKEPSGGMHTIEFTEDLRFGGDPDIDEDAYWLGANVFVDVNEKGHMFVLDPREGRIMEYDPEGHFIEAIGRKGSGPGEFQNLLYFKIVKGNELIAFEPMGAVGNFSYFDAKKTFIERKSHKDLANIFGNVQISNTGGLIGALAIGYDPKNPNMKTKVGIYGPDFKEITNLSENEQPTFNPQKSREPNYWSEFISENISTVLKGQGVVGFDQQGNVYTAHARAYEITKWSPDLKTKLRVIKRDYQRIPFSDELLAELVEPVRQRFLEGAPQLANLITDNVVKRAVEITDFPPAQNPVHGLIPMDNGGLLVIHEVNPGQRTARADIFSPDGKYMGHVTKGDNAFLDVTDTFRCRMIFKNGYAYTVVTDEDAENYVVRYKYKIVKQ